MASSSRPLAVIFIIIFLANAVNSFSAREFDSMLDTLRVRGYDLFCNAIVTSDLQFELLFNQNDTVNHHSFTFFAPVDSSLFALDMTQTASSYIDTLRFHVVPRRLTVSDLLRLPYGFSLPTLLPKRYLNVTHGDDLRSVAVGGVDVAFPGLFYGRDVAVHGLSGILSLRSDTATGVFSGPPMPAVAPVRSSDPRSFYPRMGPSSSENHPVLAPSGRPIVSPIPKFTPFNVISPSGSPPPVEKIPPVNRTVHSPAPEPDAANRHSPTGSPVNRNVHAPEPVNHGISPGSWTKSLDYSHSPAGLPVIQGFSPASSTESPVASSSSTQASELLEYRYSLISAPPSEYSDAADPAALDSDVRLPKRHRVTLIETFTDGLEGMMETVGFARSAGDGTAADERCA